MTKTNEEKMIAKMKKYEDRIMKLEKNLEAIEIEEKEKNKLRELEHNVGKETNPVHIPKIYEERIMKLEQQLEVAKIDLKEKTVLDELEHNIAKEANTVYAKQKFIMFTMFMIFLFVLFMIMASLIF